MQEQGVLRIEIDHRYQDLKLGEGDRDVRSKGAFATPSLWRTQKNQRQERLLLLSKSGDVGGRKGQAERFLRGRSRGRCSWLGCGCESGGQQRLLALRLEINGARRCLGQQRESGVSLRRCSMTTLLRCD